jgi:hypothetical protein
VLRHLLGVFQLRIVTVTWFVQNENTLLMNFCCLFAGNRKWDDIINAACKTAITCPSSKILSLFYCIVLAIGCISVFFLSYVFCFYLLIIKHVTTELLKNKYIKLTIENKNCRNKTRRVFYCIVLAIGSESNIKYKCPKIKCQKIVFMVY